MHEQQLSQTESRRLAAYLRRKYQPDELTDAMMFWRLTPSSVEDKLSREFAITLSVADICEAIGRN